MIKIFFDLDGTLIDCSKRNYFVYKTITERYKIKTLHFATYWRFKKSKASVIEDSKILKSFMIMIESSQALEKDKIFFFTKEVLNILKNKNCQLYLVSCRTFKDRAAIQLKKLGIYNYFSKVCFGKATSGYETKVNHIKKHIKKGDKVYVVGDTEDDILSAKMVGATSIAVLSGIRNKKTLLKFNPDFIVNDIRSLSKIIFNYVTVLSKNSKK